MVSNEQPIAEHRPAAIWHNIHFLLLWSGQAVSGLGNSVSQLAFPLLVLAATGSPAQAGLVTALESIPPLVLMLPAGALVDRWNRKRLMIVCDLGRALALGSVPLALAFGDLTLVQLAIVALIEGALSTFFGIAAVACLPQVVEQPQVAQALAISSITDSAIGFAGPPLGGLLYALQRALPFGADAVSFLISVLSLTLIKIDFQQVRVARSERLRTEIGIGIRWLWQHSLLRTLALLSSGLYLFSLGYTLIIIVRAQELHASTFEIGILFATGGIGGILGAILTPWLLRRYSIGAIMLVASWIFVLTWPPYAFAPNLIWLGIINIAGWIILPVFTVTQSSYRLAVVPDHLQGRVNSVYRLISVGSQPLSLALTGLLLQRFGTSQTVLLITAPQLLFVIIASFQRSLRTIPKLSDVGGRYNTAE